MRELELEKLETISSYQAESPIKHIVTMPAGIDAEKQMLDKSMAMVVFTPMAFKQTAGSWPTDEELLKLLPLSRPQIRSCILELEDLDYVRREPLLRGIKK